MVKMLGAILFAVSLASLSVPAARAADGSTPSPTVRQDDDQHPKRHHRKHRKHHHHRHHKHQDSDQKPGSNS